MTPPLSVAGHAFSSSREASSRRRVSRLISAALLGLGLAIGLSATPARISAQVTPVTERPIAFDSAGRVQVMTPALIARFSLTSPTWPVAESFREARLYEGSDGGFVLAVQRPDGSIARYPLSQDNVQLLRTAIADALRRQAERGDRSGAAATGLEVSEPAGNVFIRNQTILGFLGYGPATAALLSDAGGGTATAGYFMAAGGSFFFAANIARQREITRAQASLASHGGTRGAIAGAMAAGIFGASGGPGYGAPILMGAIGGSIAGFQGGRGLSDGEAASSGLGADLAALTTLGLAGAGGVFKAREETIVLDGGFTFTQQKDELRTGGKIALASAIGTGLVGYALGPRYARRADYNVTAGDAKIAFTGALIGALAAGAVLGDNTDEQVAFGVATAGLLGGFFAADRGLVRSADRTGADGTIVQLGAAAGGLIGLGLAAGAEAGQRPTLLMVTAGGLLGMLAADAIVNPAPDAGPLRGIMQTGSRASADESRVTVSLGSLVSALALSRSSGSRTLDGVPHLPLNGRAVSRRLPVVRVAF
jgi:hypothetical protein